MSIIKVIILFLGTVFVSHPAYCENSFFDKFAATIKSWKSVTVAEIMEDTREIKGKVERLKDNLVLKSVQKHNALIDEINDKVSSKTWYLFEKEDQEKFEIILEGMEHIKDFYQDLKRECESGEFPEELGNYIRRIESYAAFLKARINKETNLKNKLQRELNTIKRSSLTPQEQEIKEKSLSHRIRLAGKREKMISEFSVNYDKLKPRLEKAKESIKLFVFTVKENAEVHSDSYKTLKLSKDIRMAYQNLQDIDVLSNIQQAMMDSWDDLEEIVDTLTLQANQII